jgi:hypothetical protein
MNNRITIEEYVNRYKNGSLIGSFCSRIITKGADKGKVCNNYIDNIDKNNKNYDRDNIVYHRCNKCIDIHDNMNNIIIMQNAFKQPVVNSLEIPNIPVTNTRIPFLTRIDHTLPPPSQIDNPAPRLVFGNRSSIPATTLPVTNNRIPSLSRIDHTLPPPSQIEHPASRLVFGNRSIQTNRPGLPAIENEMLRRLVLFFGGMSILQNEDDIEEPPPPPPTKINQHDKTKAVPIIEDEIEEDVKNPCTICLDKPRIYASVPCGHLSLCESCGKDDGLAKIKNSCPCCRENITGLLRIYNN